MLYTGFAHQEKDGMNCAMLTHMGSQGPPVSCLRYCTVYGKFPSSLLGTYIHITHLMMISFSISIMRKWRCIRNKTFMGTYVFVCVFLNVLPRKSAFVKARKEKSPVSAAQQVGKSLTCHRWLEQSGSECWIPWIGGWLFQHSVQSSFLWSFLFQKE